MTRAARSLWLLYAAGAGLAASCAVDYARRGAAWDAAGLAAVTVLLVVAVGRDYLAAKERRVAARRAERAARLRALSAYEPGMRRLADAIALDAACCERWWTSAGAEHDPITCTRKDQTT